MDKWYRLDCSDWTDLGTETQSSEDASWLVDENQTKWLYKPAGIQPRDGRRDGEDWSELAATLVASALGVPHAEVRLCNGPKGEGSISRTVIPKAYDMHEGRVWMPDQLDLKDFEPRVPVKDILRPSHSLSAIRASLEGVAAPPGFDAKSGLSGFDVFAGYLCLDALIANCDRHEQNWAVLEPNASGPEPTLLAPSFDHASGLGYNLTDDRRQKLVDDPALLRAFAERGRAHRFEHTKGRGPVSLVTAATQALALASREARQHWTQRIETLDLAPVEASLTGAGCAAMSEAARTMASKLLILNQRRLRDELATCT